MNRISRRDFLKLAAQLPLGLAASRAAGSLRAPTDQQNVLIVVFDALSAYNVSLYGYGRATMPNLSRLAGRAIVYHNHHSGSNFTTPGTATILTGTLPWTHRAMEGKGTVADPFERRNIFNAFGDAYRLSYSHNGWVNILLQQFKKDLDELVPWKSLFLESYDAFLQTLFGNDSDIASVSWTRNMDVGSEGYSYSLFLSHIYEALLQRKHASMKKMFPRGIPSTGNIGSEFLLEDGIDWVGNRLQRIPQPFFGYFHFLPPHGPYNTSLKHFGQFSEDGFKPVQKPEDIFSRHFPPAALMKRRTEYDEFILYVDEQFGRLYDELDASGLLKNTWLVLTSDHGELNERGISGHTTQALYQPVVRVPLLIFEPGRKERLDISTPTSAIDLQPTLLKVTGRKAADWSEGAVLPPFAEAEPERSIYAVKSDKNGKFAPLEHATAMLVKGRYKLMYYYGFGENGAEELVRFYDLEADPEEMNDLSSSMKGSADELLHELKAKIKEVNQPYL